MKCLLLPLLSLSLLASPSPGQTVGSIKGKITDPVTNSGLPGANIILKGASPNFGASSDAEGKFEIKNVPTGDYTALISNIGFKPKELNLTVYPNQAVLIEATLVEDVASLEEVVIKAQPNTSTEISVITELKKAEQIAVGISSQQIQKSQDRDASQVIKRVPGVSIQDGRFVIVRGLNERYNAVMLNDAITPSTEIDTKSFAFDLIPSSAIDRMLIYKSGAAELPGEFSGGIIKIYTKTIPDRQGISLSVSTAYRSGTTFSDALDYNGQRLDWFGLGASGRQLPRNFPVTDELTAGNKPGASTLEAFKGLDNFFDVRQINARPDLRLTLGANKIWNLGDVRLTTFNNVSYSNSNFNFPTSQYRYYAFQADEQRSEILQEYNDSFFSNEVRLGGMSNWALVINPNNKIEFRNIFNQLSTKETNFRRGVNDDTKRELENYAFRYESKSIYSGQLSGTHELAKSLTFKWNGAYSFTKRSEPDYRRIVTSRNIGSTGPFTSELTLLNTASLERSARFYSKLDENTGMIRADLEKRIDKAGYEGNEEMQIKLRAGLYVENKSRVFDARWFNLANSGRSPKEILSQPPTELYSAENISADKLFYRERTNYDDHYSASNLLTAAYVGAVIPFTEKIHATFGFRAELNRQQLTSRLRGSGRPVEVDNPIFRPLPSVNISYNFTRKTLLRLAYSTTLNRPEFRELAPFTYYDFLFDVSRIGNPNLKTPTIHNADLRYEFYPNESEMVSISGFYKYFINPIEAKVRYSGSGTAFTVDNARNAFALGAEVEIRKSLSQFTNINFINNLTILANAAVIRSDVLTGFAGQEENRQLQGQSPYLVNAGIYYNEPHSGWQVNILYNVVGRRIFLVGDKEVQPTVWEMPRNVFDLNVTKQFGQHLEVKLGVQDILNQAFRLIQDSNLDQNITNTDEIYQTFKRGTYTSLGVTYIF